MEIIRNNQSISVSKPNGTDVQYFIFDEAEIHLNRMGAYSVQEWHHHNRIDENLLIIKGCLLCKYKDADGKMQQFYAAEGDAVRVHQSIHTFENDTDDEVRFVVFRYVPTGENKRELIKNDKVIDDSAEFDNTRGKA